MLEIISALTPFLLLGLVAAGLSRLSGVALSMVVVPTLLIWGATAVDVIAFYVALCSVQQLHYGNTRYSFRL